MSGKTPISGMARFQMAGLDISFVILIYIFYISVKGIAYYIAYIYMYNM